MPWRPHGRASVDVPPRSAWAVCDRCGMLRDQSDLAFQFDWRGSRLMNLRILVCKDTCLDVPQQQLRPIILPPDPPPVMNSRPENYASEDAGISIDNENLYWDETNLFWDLPLLNWP